MRIPYEDMLNEFQRVLLKKGIDKKTSFEAATNFAQTSLDGVYSHGINRFPRVVSYIDNGIIDPGAEPVCEMKCGAMERWNGNFALGNTNAMKAMDRAIELAKEHGVGVIAIRNTNHWMRGGAFGWQAADKGCIGICWTNTMPNMPAYGAKDRRIGNNPLILAVPRSNGAHVVIDCALSQFSYGKIEEYKLKGKSLPVPGGYDSEGNITSIPDEIEKTWRVLPIGFWKGSGLSIVLDMVAAILSGGNSVGDIGDKIGEETGLSQVLIAIDPTKFSSREEIDTVVNRVIEYVKESETIKEDGAIFYPGESSLKIRKDNLENGIPVVEEIWNTILNM
jgi:3-dehydro-L-gulonate 2-dehydrogenase